MAFHEASGSCLLASGTLLSHRESAGSIDNAMPLRATLHRAATFYRKGKRRTLAGTLDETKRLAMEVVAGGERGGGGGRVRRSGRRRKRR